MFRLFKRTKVERWELDLLRNSIINLPNAYSSLINQIDDGLLRGVLVDISDIPNYVAFTFNSNILGKYDRKNGLDYKLTNLKVYDNRSLSFLPFEIYVSSGTISGYVLGGNNKRKIDLNRIEVSSFRKEFIKSFEFDRINSVFSEEEKSLISPSEVYSIFIEDKEYFHIRDLEDGDFIGIDKDKVVYKITHDPMEVKRLEKELLEVLR